MSCCGFVFDHMVADFVISSGESVVPISGFTSRGSSSTGVNWDVFEGIVATVGKVRTDPML